MIWLPGGEKTVAIHLAFLTQYRSVTNKRTDAWTTLPVLCLYLYWLYGY